MTEPRLDRLIGQPGSPLRYGLGGLILPFVVACAVLPRMSPGSDETLLTMAGLILYGYIAYAIHLRRTDRAAKSTRDEPAAVPAPIPVPQANPLFVNGYAATWRSLQDAPTCRWEAAQAAQELYRLGGLHPPGLTVWARSPCEALLMERLLHLFFRRIHVRGESPAVAWERVARLPIKPATRLWDARERLDAEVSRRLRTRFGRSFSGALDGSGVGPLVARDTEARPAATTLLKVAATQATNMEVAIEEALRHEMGRRVVPNPLGLSRARDRFVFGYDRGWSSLAGEREQMRARHLVRLGLAASGWRPLSGAVVLIERPVACNWSDGGQLQALDGPALVWPDGWEVFAWDGQAVTREMVLAPECLDLSGIRGMAPAMRRVAVTRYGEERYRAEASATLELIRCEPDPQVRRSLVTQYGEERYRAEGSAGLDLVRSEPDAWIRRELIGRYGAERYREEVAASLEMILAEPDPAMRRELIERYGAARYVQETGRVIDHDLDALGEPRRLWSAPRRLDTSLVLIEVVNSTPEADGTRHNYWLRVPPGTRTCRAAVAWTFGLPPDAYAPVLET